MPDSEEKQSKYPQAQDLVRLTRAMRSAETTTEQPSVMALEPPKKQLESDADRSIRVWQEFLAEDE